MQRLAKNIFSLQKFESFDLEKFRIMHFKFFSVYSVYTCCSEHACNVRNYSSGGIVETYSSMNFFSLNHAMSILLSVRLSRGKVRRPPTTVVFVIQSDYTTSFEVLLFAVFSFSASTGWLHCIFLSFAVLVPDMLWSNCH